MEDRTCACGCGASLDGLRADAKFARGHRQRAWKDSTGYEVERRLERLAEVGDAMAVLLSGDACAAALGDEAGQLASAWRKARKASPRALEAVA